MTEGETKPKYDLEGAVKALAAGAQKLREAGEMLEGGPATKASEADTAQGLAEEVQDIYLRAKALDDRVELNATAG